MKPVCTSSFCLYSHCTFSNFKYPDVTVSQCSCAVSNLQSTWGAATFSGDYSTPDESTPSLLQLSSLLCSSCIYSRRTAFKPTTWFCCLPQSCVMPDWIKPSRPASSADVSTQERRKPSTWTSWLSATSDWMDMPTSHQTWIKCMGPDFIRWSHKLETGYLNGNQTTMMAYLYVANKTCFALAMSSFSFNALILW